jgi:superfamily II DNA helicase RecQ
MSGLRLQPSSVALALLRPSPILALTATATVRVQDDIVTQLGIENARRFIHGFRRHNLAIEAVERPRGEREDLALAMLESRSGGQGLSRCSGESSDPGSRTGPGLCSLHPIGRSRNWSHSV